MVLWSKGLGKLVLRLSLADRSATGHSDGKLVIDGTMGPPTHWDYAVNMNEEDVLDFVELLKQPAPVRYVVEGEQRGKVVRPALMRGFLFTWNTILCFLGAAPGAATPPAEAASNATAEVKTTEKDKDRSE
jgi:hypothetical protein